MISGIISARIRQIILACPNLQDFFLTRQFDFENKIFGFSVDMDEAATTIIVGEPEHSATVEGAPYPLDIGRVFVFKRQPSQSWLQVQEILGNTNFTIDEWGSVVYNSNFGHEVKIAKNNPDVFIVSSTQETKYAYVYRRDVELDSYFQDSIIQTVPESNTGYLSIDINADGTKVVLGDPYNDNGPGAGNGAVETWVYSASAWTNIPMIASDGTFELYGTFVKLNLSGNELFVYSTTKIDPWVPTIHRYRSNVTTGHWDFIQSFSLSSDYDHSYWIYINWNSHQYSLSIDSTDTYLVTSSYCQTYGKNQITVFKKDANDLFQLYTSFVPPHYNTYWAGSAAHVSTNGEYILYNDPDGLVDNESTGVVYILAHDPINERYTVDKVINASTADPNNSGNYFGTMVGTNSSLCAMVIGAPYQTLVDTVDINNVSDNGAVYFIGNTSNATRVTLPSITTSYADQGSMIVDSGTVAYDFYTIYSAMTEVFLNAVDSITFSIEPSSGEESTDMRVSFWTKKGSYLEEMRWGDDPVTRVVTETGLYLFKCGTRWWGDVTKGVLNWTTVRV